MLLTYKHPFICKVNTHLDTHTHALGVFAQQPLAWVCFWKEWLSGAFRQLNPPEEKLLSLQWESLIKSLLERNPTGGKRYWDVTSTRIDKECECEWFTKAVRNTRLDVRSYNIYAVKMLVLCLGTVYTLTRYWYCWGFLSKPRRLSRSSSPPSISW